MEKNAFFHNSSTNEEEEEEKELYWNTNAPRLAKEMDILEEELKYENAKKDWMEKARILTPNSIKEFLNNANDWDEEDKGQRY